MSRRALQLVAELPRTGMEIITTPGTVQDGMPIEEASLGLEGELANRFASVDPAQLRLKYDQLNDAIDRQTESLTAAVANVSAQWDALVPYFSEMQRLLSQRGDQRLREAGLPTWTAWVDAFKKKVGWQITLRGIQKRLAALRERTPLKTKSSPGPRLSAKDQQRLLMAAQVGTEIVEAYENNFDLKNLIAEYKRISLDSRRICSILEVQDQDSVADALNARVTELAVEAFEILNGRFGDRLLGSADGNRVMFIAKQILNLKARRRGPRRQNSSSYETKE